LYDWTAGESNDYEDLSELYGELTQTFSRYVGHVVTNVGGVKEERLRPNQEGNIYTPVSAKEQTASLDWLIKNAFSNLDWLNQAKIVRNVGPANHVENMRQIQVRVLNSLLSPDRLVRLIENEVKGVDYTAADMIAQLQQGIWSELATGSKIDVYRRNLQKAYIDRATYLLTDQPTAQATAAARPGAAPVNVSQSDIRSIVRANLIKLQQQLKAASLKYPNDVTKYHVDDVVARIDQTLNKDKK
jgi:hypothetical protein